MAQWRRTGLDDARIRQRECTKPESLTNWSLQGIGRVHSAFHDSVQGREAAPAATGAPLGDFHQGVILGIEPPRKLTPSKTLTI
jgi:hypothetical protein